jgi:hypothetical protein
MTHQTELRAEGTVSLALGAQGLVSPRARPGAFFRHASGLESGSSLNDAL